MNIKARAKSLIVMVIICICMPLQVFAADLTSSEISALSKYISSIAKSDGTVNLSNKYLGEGAENTVEITYSYKDSSGTVQEGNITLNADTAGDLAKKAESSNVQSQVDDLVSTVGITANTAGATEMMSGVTPIIELLVGFVAYGIVIFLPLISALDILYLTVPFFREKCEDAKSNNMGGNNMMVKTKGGGETKLRWISDEAQYAAKYASYEDGKSPLSIYFAKRVWAYILVAIVLFMLITGNIDLITQLAVKVVSGFMSVLDGLAS